MPDGSESPARSSKEVPQILRAGTMREAFPGGPSTASSKELPGELRSRSSKEMPRSANAYQALDHVMTKIGRGSKNSPLARMISKQTPEQKPKGGMRDLKAAGMSVMNANKARGSAFLGLLQAEALRQSLIREGRFELLFGFFRRLFPGFGDELVVNLALGCTEVKKNFGSVITLQGAPAKHLYFIFEGSCRVEGHPWRHVPGQPWRSEDLLKGETGPIKNNPAPIQVPNGIVLTIGPNGQVVKMAGEPKEGAKVSPEFEQIQKGTLLSSADGSQDFSGPHGEGIRVQFPSTVVRRVARRWPDPQCGECCHWRETMLVKDAIVGPEALAEDGFYRDTVTAATECHLVVLDASVMPKELIAQVLPQVLQRQAWRAKRERHVLPRTVIDFDESHRQRWRQQKTSGAHCVGKANFAAVRWKTEAVTNLDETLLHRGKMQNIPAPLRGVISRCTDSPKKVEQIDLSAELLFQLEPQRVLRRSYTAPHAAWRDGPIQPSKR